MIVQTELSEFSNNQRSHGTLYDELVLSPRQIRLLRIKDCSQSKDQPLECDMVVRSLGQQPSFKALSYCWGTEGATLPIIINGHHFMVRPNLHSYQALMVEETQVTWIYIDAICINQQDLVEKGPQITLMGEIYRDATEVVAWLGVEGDALFDIHENMETWQLFFDMAAMSLAPTTLAHPQEQPAVTTLQPSNLINWLGTMMQYPRLLDKNVLLPADKVYGLYGMTACPFGVNYDPASSDASTTAIGLGLLEIISLAELSGDWKSRAHNSAMFICRLLIALGLDLYSAETTCRIKAYCKVFSLDSANVCRAWEAQRINWKPTHEIPHGSLKHKAYSKVITKMIPALSVRYQTLSAGYCDTVDNFFGWDNGDAQMLFGVRKLLEGLSQVKHFESVMLGAQDLLSGSPETAGFRVMVIERFLIPAGANMLARKAMDALQPAIASLRASDDEETRNLLQLYSSWCDDLQKVLDRPDEESSNPESSLQGKRDASHIVDFVNSRRFAIAAAGSKWVIGFAEDFPIQLQRSAERVDLPAA